MARPRVSISDEALSMLDGVIEDVGLDIVGSCRVVRAPWVVLTLERTAKDENADRFPVVCRDGMAPIVVSIFRAAAKTCAEYADDECAKQLRRAASAFVKLHDLGPIPTAKEAVQWLIKSGDVVAN